MSRQMIVATTLEELATSRALLDDPLGFVPTMGYLHEGHLSLARRARAECRSVAASIFVNPTQFGPSEDLAKYPRDLERDLRLLEEAEVDLVWTPTAEIMYPTGYQTWVEVGEVSLPLLGPMRASAEGQIPSVGPRGGKRWTPRYFVRRAAWHVLDHAWEIEDRAE